MKKRTCTHTTTLHFYHTSSPLLSTEEQGTILHLHLAGMKPWQRREEFPQDKKGISGGKAKLTLINVTGSQDTANTNSLFFSNRRVPPCNCFSSKTKGIELGVQGSRRRGVEKGKPAEFQTFGVYLQCCRETAFQDGMIIDFLMDYCCTNLHSPPKNINLRIIIINLSQCIEHSD